MSEAQLPADDISLRSSPGAGIRDDLRRRLPYYLDDFARGLHPKVLASTLFLFFACLANAIAFGGLTSIVTGGQIGTVEMIVATAIGGVVFALFAGQPLTILGGTGPIVIFTGLLYVVCDRLQLPFLPAYAWVGMWSGLFLVALSLTNTCVLMRYFTRFTDEIFAALVALIFIVEASVAIVRPFQETAATDSTELLTLVLAFGTFLLARTLSQITRTRYASRSVREFLSDFGPAIAIAAMTGFAVFESGVTVAVPAVPSGFAPTADRTWLVDIFAFPMWAIFAAIIPALMATILLFLDQNITTRLVNANAHKLTKGPGFHLDLLVVGLITAAFSLFALPWIVAATVHALNHVRSLADTTVTGEGNNKSEQIVSVRENRVSALTIHLLIGGALFALPTIHLIPMPVLFGLFLFMGFNTLAGNQFFNRVMLWITEPKLYPDSHFVRTVPSRIIHRFTLIQAALLGALWVLKASVFGILFPVLIALLVPGRMVLQRWFDADHLAALDADEDPEVLAEGALSADVHP